MVIRALLSGAILTGLFAFAGCTAKKQTEELKDMSDDERKALADYKAELEIGRKMAAQLLGFYGAYPDQELTDYVNKVGLLVASYSDFPDRRYMFSILKTEEVNAFAAPGGYILLSLGAIRLAENEAQLAAILGHEITHVGARHMMSTLERMNEEEEKKKNEGRPNDPPPESVTMRKRVDTQSNDPTAKYLAKYLGGGVAASLNVIKAASQGMSTLLEKGLDHNFEYSADAEGTKFSIRAGYAPRAPIEFLQMLKKKIKAKDSVFTRTHPGVAERIAKLEQVIKDEGATEIIGAEGKKRFARFKKRVKPLPAAS